jgi:antitoxin VapB
MPIHLIRDSLDSVYILYYHVYTEVFMLSIRNPEVESLARELAGAEGSSMTEIILDALKDRLAETRTRSERTRAILRSIAADCAAAPDLDTRDPDAILGYGETGGFGHGGG